MAPNSGPLVDHQSTLLATEGGPLVDHQKTLLSATNGGPLPISRSCQWLATTYSQRQTDNYATGEPMVALQSLAIWVQVHEEV